MKIDQDVVGNSRKVRSLVHDSILCFPEEIMCEILSWLDVKSLLRCKCVCKLWYVLIEDKEFVETHLRRSKGRIHYIKHTGSIVNHEGIEEKIAHLSTCEGLLLEKRISAARPSGKYRVINPSTREILDIPDPRKKVHVISLYINLSTGSYNVVSVNIEKESGSYNFEVLDLGPHGNGPFPYGDFSWKTLNITGFHNYTGRGNYDRCSGLGLCLKSEGALYVYRIRRFGSSNAEIIRVDVEKEECTTSILSRSLFSNWENVFFQFWNRKPTLICHSEEKLHVLVLEDHTKQKWANKIVISLPYLKLCPDLVKLAPSLMRVDGEDVVMYRNDLACLIYNYKSKVLSGISPEKVKGLHIFDNLASVKGMQPEKNWGDVNFTYSPCEIPDDPINNVSHWSKSLFPARVLARF